MTDSSGPFHYPFKLPAAPEFLFLQVLLFNFALPAQLSEEGLSTP